jgi:hypothetical protein
MQKQREQRIGSTDKEWVHEMVCFAWSHPFVNIYQSIAVDMLHQLQKGVFRDLMNWITLLIQDLFPGQRATKTKKKKNRTNKESLGIVQLDARFAAVPPYPGLRHFSHFSHIQQWTGNEERDLIRILIPVITPLLLSKAPDALTYARALVDFITLTQYRTHNDESLRYLSHALVRIDHTKESFAKYRPKDANNEAHWNYPKFHALGHYIEFIRTFGAPNGFDTEHMEAAHKFLLKDFYTRTNRNSTYLNQIAGWNTRETNRKAMEHILLHHLGTTSQEGLDIEAQVTSMSLIPFNVEIFGCRPQCREIQVQWRSLRLDIKSTTTAAEAQRATGLHGFTAALAIFIKKSRSEIMGDLIINNQRDICEADSTWVDNYPVQLYGSLKCWRRTGKDETDSEAQEPELLRCHPKWRRGSPRGDFCWVQEHSPSEHARSPASNYPFAQKEKMSLDPDLNGQLVGQIRALIKVIDIGYPGNSRRHTTPGYCAALVDVYPLKNHGIPHPVHGMIEVTRPRIPTSENHRSLKGRRFYALPTVLRSAHIIPSSLDPEPRLTDVFYVNNYIDWDQYQVLYEEDWEEKGLQRARKIKQQHELAKKKARANTGST